MIPIFSPSIRSNIQRVSDAELSVKISSSNNSHPCSVGGKEGALEGISERTELGIELGNIDDDGLFDGSSEGSDDGIVECDGI
mmetsp:Transcript_18021/g.36833  ORF Transcript_18021/g.36833 Transcript_18021/m.36833 type:complete len:83 (-) Transcript_18021:675-923(-)